ncbi:unnamed protein product [Somion occarium]|uniref:Angiogenic factor with G patch and FHA domains 1 n=1 Tax=Somion occarium TaxID=3059160 RepID=A0ABP1EB25_9APHY
MEDGEIQAEDSYDPKYEWPGSDNPAIYDFDNYGVLTPTEPRVDEPATSDTGSSSLASLRLLIGRDVAPPASETPRIRLKEMEVSKIHATIYWDGGRKEWSVVDMGSKHGTFLQSFASTSAARAIRLSSPRVASIPRRLRHGDQLTVGGTTFIVHIHENRMPCVDCSAAGGDEIELFDNRRRQRERESAQKRKHEAMESPSTAPVPTERDPKRAITMLKRSLLSRHDPSSPASSSGSPNAYLDRSARRRAFHPDTTPTPSRNSTPFIDTRLPIQSLPATPEPVSAPAVPLPSSNVGHRLLMKQGWQPGTALGTPDDSPDGTIALTEPLDLAGNIRRTGLGSSKPLAPQDSRGPEDWRAVGRMRRWATMHSTDRSVT